MTTLKEKEQAFMTEAKAKEAAATAKAKALIEKERGVFGRFIARIKAIFGK